jgi:hypothetical protein
MTSDVPSRPRNAKVCGNALVTGGSSGWSAREPTDGVVRGILRRLDGRRAFVLPTWRAWMVVTLAAWLPAAYDWIMCGWGPAFSGRSRPRGS